LLNPRKGELASPTEGKRSSTASEVKPRFKKHGKSFYIEICWGGGEPLSLPKEKGRAPIYGGKRKVLRGGRPAPGSVKQALWGILGSSGKGPRGRVVVAQSGVSKIPSAVSGAEGGSLECKAPLGGGGSRGLPAKGKMKGRGHRDLEQKEGNSKFPRGKRPRVQVALLPGGEFA